MTHMYFSARTEGRISYGHLGRTNSCLYYVKTLSIIVSYCVMLFQCNMWN